MLIFATCHGQYRSMPGTGTALTEGGALPDAGGSSGGFCSFQRAFAAEISLPPAHEMAPAITSDVASARGVAPSGGAFAALAAGGGGSISALRPTGNRTLAAGFFPEAGAGGCSDPRIPHPHPKKARLMGYTFDPAMTLQASSSRPVDLMAAQGKAASGILNARANRRLAAGFSSAGWQARPQQGKKRHHAKIESACGRIRGQGPPH